MFFFLENSKTSQVKPSSKIAKGHKLYTKKQSNKVNKLQSNNNIHSYYKLHCFYFILKPTKRATKRVAYDKSKIS